MRLGNDLLRRAQEHLYPPQARQAPTILLPFSRPCRFLDDIFGIWTGNHTDEWSSYKADLNNFGILTWEVSDLSTSVDFLDLTLSIENGRIVSKTYQKPMNLFLYLPPSSAHPLAVSKALSTVSSTNIMPKIPIARTISTL